MKNKVKQKNNTKLLQKARIDVQTSKLSASSEEEERTNAGAPHALPAT